MLYVFSGNEIKAREKMRMTLNALMKRASLANVMRVSDEEIGGISMDELLSSQGLFYSKRIVVFDNAFGDKDAHKKILQKLKEMAQSQHVFLVFEENPNAEFQKQLKKYATKTETIGEKQGKTKFAPDWSAANALEKRDPKKLWIAVARASIDGTAPEMTHGQLFWKAKQIMLAGRFSVWSKTDLQKLISDLAELPHQSRRRSVELGLALENFALKINHRTPATD